MDILIKDMEMPQERKMIVVEPDGSVWEQIYDTSFFCTGYKAIKVKPHGRLIDADALYKMVDSMDKCSMSKVLEYILDAPTILEASDGDNHRM